MCPISRTLSPIKARSGVDKQRRARKLLRVGMENACRAQGHMCYFLCVITYPTLSQAVIVALVSFTCYDLVALRFHVFGGHGCIPQQSVLLRHPGYCRRGTVSVHSIDVGLLGRNEPSSGLFSLVLPTACDGPETSDGSLRWRETPP